MAFPSPSLQAWLRCRASWDLPIRPNTPLNVTSFPISRPESCSFKSSMSQTQCPAKRASPYLQPEH
ncbi:hypothetical protein BC830DRAFT_1132037 [Chytriomyces sp. MP71]|nr:hypothetical protein BC830DRAFT_1132037 [Chytriomyces sp. MP71]